MRKADDPRHIKRIKIMQYLFSECFITQEDANFSYLNDINFLKKNLQKIDSIIEKAAPVFPIAKIAKIDLSILRLAIYELLIEKKVPPKVIIDESVELAKQFGGEGSPGFVNGVLGFILKDSYNEKS
jgi:N utilization substance protein B